MGSLSFNLPLPVLNGPGAAVDISSLGGPLTFTCVGSFQGASIAIEISNDGGLSFTPLLSFSGAGGERVVPAAAQWARTNVAGRGVKPWLSFSANVDVGGTDAGSTFDDIPLPLLSGAGTPIATDAFENFCTFVCTGSFPGAAIAIQISEDNTDWATIASFNGRGGVISRAISAQFMRTFVNTEDSIVASVSVGSTQIGGGGGGSSGIAVQDEAAPVGSGFTTLNFAGAGVTATDAGGGVALVTIPGGSSLPTDGGQAGVTGAGTGGDPLIPVAGPFRPVNSVFVFDDYMTYYPLSVAGVVLGTGNTSILKSGGGTTAFSVNDAAGPLGPGNGSMMGVMDLIMAGAASGEFISATQFRDGNDSGQCINMDLITGAFDLLYASRVSFEGLNNFETNQHAYAGFREQIDLSVIGTREGAWFHPKDNGLQVNWFAFYRIADDTGIVTADVDTGVRVGFTPAHPFDGKAAQNLMIRFDGTIGACNLNMYIDGVLVVGPIALVNPTSRFTPMEALRSDAAGQSNTMYVDWALWYLNPGRIV